MIHRRLHNNPIVAESLSSIGNPKPATPTPDSLLTFLRRLTIGEMNGMESVLYKTLESKNSLNLTN